MKQLVISLLLTASLLCPAMGQELSELSSKIAGAVKVQGTIVGQSIAPSAILDDIIVREGDTVLVDEASGRLVGRLGNKELDDYPVHLQARIVSITHGNVVLLHDGTNLSIRAR